MAEGSVLDEHLVERLIGSQFPHWAELSVRAAESEGHDNRTFRLGEELGVRVPRSPAYAGRVADEHTWLPRIAPHLTVPIPLPLALGQPSPDLPWAWSVNRWVGGRDARSGGIEDLPRFAVDLAGFLRALQGVDAAGAPRSGAANFHRGGRLRVYDLETRQCIRDLRTSIDPDRATSVWEAALDSAPSAPPVWVHGDVAVGNLLVAQGALSGVIDFGQFAAGDPACDLTIAWTLFRGESRSAFRRALALDEATWTRARGWALWKALLQLRSRVAGAAPVLEEILAD